MTGAEYRFRLPSFLRVGLEQPVVAMLPSIAARYQPAVTVMKSIVTAFEQNARKDDKPAMPGMPTVETRPRVRDMQAINDYYFGSHISPNELMIRMVERMVDHLNGKLDIGSDGDPDAVKAGNAWRDEALAGGTDIGAEDDFRIPKPGEDGVTFRQVARMIQTRFSADFLSEDRQLMKALEEMTGFRLDGMTAADLLQAFVEPEGETALKVREVLSEGLAGQKGSKASQRLEAAVEGPVSVQQAAAATLRKEAYEETDDETAAEDLQRVADARTQQRLEQVGETQDKVAEAVNDAAKDGSDHPDAAAEIIQGLAAQADAEPQDVKENDLEDILTSVDDGEGLPLEGEDIQPGEALDSAISNLNSSDARIRAYLETLLAGDEAAQQRRWPELA